MKRIITLPSLLLGLSLAACGASSGEDSNSSPHGTAPGSTTTAAADEPVPEGTPAETSDEVAEGDEPEDNTPELDKSDAGDVGQTADAISSTTGTQFKFTYYWIAQRPVGDPNQVTLRDCAGAFLTYASYAWRDQVKMEMTGRFTKSDGTKVTFNDANGCWKKMTSAYTWGMGVPSPTTNISYKLRPFRSIAVDRNTLSIGKWYYIKELDGVQMPYPVSTMRHNGCVRAVDIGYGVFGNHIDFFAGLKSAYGKLVNSSTTIGGKTSVTVYSGTTKCATHIARGY